MKLTKSQLKQLIKEELQNIMLEQQLLEGAVNPCYRDEEGVFELINMNNQYSKVYCEQKPCRVVRLKGEPSDSLKNQWEWVGSACNR